MTVVYGSIMKVRKRETEKRKTENPFYITDLPFPNEIDGRNKATAF